jgi:kinesin family member C2/C3
LYSIDTPTGGQAKTLMFVHISPENDSVGETISTLKFAERVSTVELGAARLNKEPGEVRELKEQVNFCYYAIYHFFLPAFT